MKRCPQCNSVYENETQFCLNDGTSLVEEHFSMPSEGEEETIIRHNPITIEFPKPDLSEPPPTQAFQPVVIVEEKSKGKNSLLFLLVGLLLGGGLVLGGILLARNFFLNRDSVNDAPVSSNSNVPPGKPTTPKTPSPTPAPIVASEKHSNPNQNADEDFLNGRVITANAYLRSGPNGDAQIVDTLPVNDRLEIIKRASPNSPWYQVTCEHGTTGWMHGNTIEFTQ